MGVLRRLAVQRFYQENDGILRAYFFAGIFLGLLRAEQVSAVFFVGFGVWLLTACGKILGIPLKGAKRMIKRFENSVVSV